MAMKVLCSGNGILFSAMLLLGTIVPGQAQKFTLGVKAGATLSISSFGDPDDRDAYTNLWKPGFFGAGLINFPMKKNYSFQSELGFAQRGRKVEFNGRTWQNYADYYLLDGGMMLRKSFPLNWTSNIQGTWYFNVGPHISYWLGGTGTVTSGGSYDYRIQFGHPPDEPTEPDFNTMYLHEVNRWMFGLDLGVGVDAPTRGTQRFAFEVRFTSGHTFYGSRSSAFNRTLGFSDNLRANEKIISFAVDYTLTRDVREAQKGKSTKKESRKSKPRKNIDSMIH
jgi:hypothetical protein